MKTLFPPYFSWYILYYLFFVLCACILAVANRLNFVSINTSFIYWIFRSNFLNIKMWLFTFFGANRREYKTLRYYSLNMIFILFGVATIYLFVCTRNQKFRWKNKKLSCGRVIHFLFLHFTLYWLRYCRKLCTFYLINLMYLL